MQTWEETTPGLGRCLKEIPRSIYIVRAPEKGLGVAGGLIYVSCGHQRLAGAAFGPREILRSRPLSRSIGIYKHLIKGGAAKR